MGSYVFPWVSDKRPGLYTMLERRAWFGNAVSRSTHLTGEFPSIPTRTERGSYKDEIVVWSFIVLCAGLLLWAGSRQAMEIYKVSSAIRHTSRLRAA